MTDRPIIFSAPMVRALLAGRKTMTRRLPWRFEDVGDNHTKIATPWQNVKPVDRLWVRENAWICPPGWTDTPVNPMGPDHQEVAYQADDLRGGTAEAARDYRLPLRSSIHMPRWASRLTLDVTAVKVERLQDISEQDALAEGMHGDSDTFGVDGIDLTGYHRPTARAAFSALWIYLHETASWYANPEVVAITFAVTKRNIDQVKAA